MQQQLTIVNTQGQVAAVPASMLATSPYVTLNQAGTQVTLLTDSFTDLAAGMAQMQALKQTVLQTLPEQRLLWPLSQASGESELAGSQLRFTLPQRLMVHLFDDYYHDYFKNYVVFQNQIYLQLAQNIQAYQFVLTYLFGATIGKAINQRMVRKVASTDYTTLASYLKTVKVVSEVSPVIFGGELPDQLVQRGIRYLDLTGLDLDPQQVDLSLAQLAFLKLFLIFCLVTPVQPVQSELALAVANHLKLSQPVQQALQDFQKSFTTFMTTYQAPVTLQTAMRPFLALLNQPTATPAVKLAAQITATNQQTVGLKLARQYAQQFTVTVPVLKGYQKLSLDTQLVMKTAYQTGCQVTLVDSQAEILRLQQQQAAWLKAGVTPFNQEITVSLLADKWFLKRRLGQAGFHVVLGNHYQSVAAALADFPDYAQQALVIKPRTAKASQGLTIFRLPPQQVDFAAAVKRALAVTGDCLVESFAPGTIYRFLILEQQVLALNEEMPANVVGDGRQTIAQLVQRKNQKRGLQLPWQPITMDEQTQFDLQQQGLTSDSVPQRGNQAYLRLAASWTTGADEIEACSEVDQSYQKLAIQIAQHLRLHYGTVTLAIANPYQTYQPDQPTQLAVIDVDSAPHLTAFEVPFFGNAANPALQVVQALVQA